MNPYVAAACITATATVGASVIPARFAKQVRDQMKGNGQGTHTVMLEKLLDYTVTHDTRHQDLEARVRDLEA